MRVLGVDPGSAVCGYGAVERRSGELRFIAAGTIRSASLEPGPKRLKRIHENLVRIIGEFAPNAISLERHFLAANVHSAFRLGEARAMAMLAAAEQDIPLFEYPPNQVKLAVAGHGHAGKADVKAMIRRLLKLEELVELSNDAADALAIAICHINRGNSPRLSESVVRHRGAMTPGSEGRLRPAVRR
ncbi:MAG TPA: crossover junction endodeoxyribonuclease RuvC [Candidatus Binataceae bacterium]|nr:crossover junction endodeoxyribonuclease RuvC [Candidatus Binataceae bacterium]